MNRMLANLVTLAALSALSSPAVAVVDGSFDTSFAGSGHIAFAADQNIPGNASEAHRIIVESNGNLLLGGNVFDGAGYYWWLGEYTSTGTPVLTFGESNGSGRVTNCYLAPGVCHYSGFTFSSFGLEADGRISVANFSTLTRTMAGAHSLDTAGVVGGNGYAPTQLQINNVQGRLAYSQALTQISGGKWLLVGNGYYTGSSGNYDFVVIRLNADLSLDADFNATTDGNGVTFAGGQIVSFGDGVSAYAHAVLSQADGRIVLVGEIPNGLGVARLNADGTLDTTFGGGTGKTEFTWSQGSLLYYNNAIPKLDRAGRLLIPMVGTLSAGATPGMVVIRLLPDGTPDSSFGTDGVSFQPFSSFCSFGVEAHALALDSAGRILVVGKCGGSTQNYFFLERLHGDDGSLDTTYGIAGRSYGAFVGTSTNDSAEDVAFDASGRPVVAGYSYPNSLQHAGVARLTYDLIFTNNMESTPPGRLPGE